MIRRKNEVFGNMSRFRSAIRVILSSAVFIKALS